MCFAKTLTYPFKISCWIARAARNSPFIQEELHISYNTTRTHVRHIYEKCGFHTQQELIDAVEKAGKG